jgi:hypothetical protein
MEIICVHFKEENSLELHLNIQSIPRSKHIPFGL